MRAETVAKLRQVRALIREDLSDMEIARRVGVHNVAVAAQRRIMLAAGENVFSAGETRFLGTQKGGRVAVAMRGYDQADDAYLDTVQLVNMPKSRKALAYFNNFD